MSNHKSPAVAPAISRAELWWLMGAVVFGTILRLSFPGRMAVEHFDEGVYASNLWFGQDEGYSYPARHLYAPPLLPSAIEWTMIAASTIGIRPSGFVPMIPCLVAGIAMIPSIWWVGRRWFGTTAGLVSAWLVATSDFHVSYSRAALTDVPVCLLILWSVYLIWLALLSAPSVTVQDSGRRKSAAVTIRPPLLSCAILMAGVITGLAWWTKYNGWLPLAIGLSGGAFWQLLTPPALRQVGRMLTRWALIAVVAIAIWSPVLWGLQKYGGYVSVAANHRQYVVGLAGWGTSALIQAGHIGQYDNWFGLLTEPFGAMSMESALIDRKIPLDSAIQQARVSGANASATGVLVRKIAVLTNRCAIFLVPAVLLIVAGVALILGLRRAVHAETRLAVCLLAAWCCGLTVATPAYHPYPRLVLPWMTAAWLATGLAVQLWRNRSWLDRDPAQNSGGRASLPGRVEWILVMWMVANSVGRSIEGTAHALRDRTGMEVIADSIASGVLHPADGQALSADGAIFYVWGEPALVCGLRANGLSYVAPIQNLDFLGKPQPLPTFLAFGKQAFESPTFSAERKKLQQFPLWKLFDPRPSELVRFDSGESRITVPSDDAAAKVWVYRVGR
jgi:dolichyl-phosphate-mannose-protein mannosyltransferase